MYMEEGIEWREMWVRKKKVIYGVRCEYAWNVNNNCVG